MGAFLPSSATLLYSTREGRALSGVELLGVQGFPIFDAAAHQAPFSRALNRLSPFAQTSVAGNSMHLACLHAAVLTVFTHVDLRGHLPGAIPRLLLATRDHGSCPSNQASDLAVAPQTHHRENSSASAADGLHFSEKLDEACRTVEDPCVLLPGDCAVFGFHEFHTDAAAPCGHQCWASAQLDIAR